MSRLFMKDLPVLLTKWYKYLGGVCCTLIGNNCPKFVITISLMCNTELISSNVCPNFPRQAKYLRSNAAFEGPPQLSVHLLYSHSLQLKTTLYTVYTSLGSHKKYPNNNILIIN